MGLSITAQDAKALCPGVWQLALPPHQIRFFGDCRKSEGATSIILLRKAAYAGHSLTFDADDVVPLNVGTTTKTIAIAEGAAADTAKSSNEAAAGAVYGPGDREFLQVAQELPPEAYEAAVALLAGIRKNSPGDLKRGLNRNFSNTPDNFWYVIVQPRVGELSVTVRGEKSRFKSVLEVKTDRPGYSRFKVKAIGDVAGALQIISASKLRS